MSTTANPQTNAYTYTNASANATRALVAPESKPTHLPASGSHDQPSLSTTSINTADAPQPHTPAQHPPHSAEFTTTTNNYALAAAAHQSPSSAMAPAAVAAATPGGNTSDHAVDNSTSASAAPTAPPHLDRQQSWDMRDLKRKLHESLMGKDGHGYTSTTTTASAGK